MTALRYENLDNETRFHMVAEIDADIEQGRANAERGLYVSNYLNDTGVQEWPGLLREAAQRGADDTLARELNRRRCFKVEVPRLQTHS